MGYMMKPGFIRFPNWLVSRLPFPPRFVPQQADSQHGVLSSLSSALRGLKEPSRSTSDTVWARSVPFNRGRGRRPAPGLAQSMLISMTASHKANCF